MNNLGILEKCSEETGGGRMRNRIIGSVFTMRCATENSVGNSWCICGKQVGFPYGVFRRRGDKWFVEA